MTEATSDPPVEVIEPLGAPTDPLRPTGPVQRREAGMAKARLAAGARKVLAVSAVVLGAAILLGLVASAAYALAFG